MRPTKNDGVTLLTISQVAERLSVSHYTVARWLREGQFPKPIFLTNLSRRWRLRDIEAFIDKRAASRRPRTALKGAVADKAKRKAVRS